MDAALSSAWGTVSVWRGAHCIEVVGNPQVKSERKIRIVRCGVAEVTQVGQAKGGTYKVNHFKGLKKRYK